MWEMVSDGRANNAEPSLADTYRVQIDMAKIAPLADQISNFFYYSLIRSKMAPREKIEIAFVADNPGDWMFHCHILEHMAGGGDGRNPRCRRLTAPPKF